MSAARSPSRAEEGRREAILGRFERDWSSGAPPRVADYLAGDGEERCRLLVELVKCDLEQRLLHRQVAELEGYFADWPALRADPEVAVKLIRWDWEMREPADPEQARGEYARRFADLADRIAGLPTPYPQAPSGHSPASTGDWLRPPPPNGPAPELPAIPGYTVEALLASGGMGEVYLADDPGLRRKVALKVIRPDRLSAHLLMRFKTEARAVAALEHPHIVQVYEVGEYTTRAGCVAPYLAMEYVAGGTLEGCAGRAPMPALEAARVVHLLARAMAHAHAKGIIHRDLKPSNVLIGPHADEPALNAGIGRPRITDFGLARCEGDGVQTMPGSVMGSPEYMAPEQADGLETGPAADVYALGAMLYRLLTGGPVFGVGSQAETLHHVRNTPPRPVGELVGGVPPDIEAVCLRCLSKRPAERPTASELAAALDRRPDPRPETEEGVKPGLQTNQGPNGPGWAAWAGAAVLALAVTALLAWRPWEAAAEKLHGELQLEVLADGEELVVAKGNTRAVPVRNGQQVRFRAKVNRDAYLYLLYHDGAGKTHALYPWNLAEKEELEPTKVKVDEAPAVEKPTRLAWWPKFAGGVEVEGPSSLDTVILIANRTPLTGEDRAFLVSQIAELAGARFSHPKEVVELSFTGGEYEVAWSSVKRGVGRTVALDKEFHAVIRPIAERVDVVRAVRFSHVGDGGPPVKGE